VPHWAHNYFTGVPSPAGAGIAIMPLIFWLFTGSEVFASPVTAGVFLLASSGLMVSQVPVYSGKHMRLKPQAALLLMVGVIAVVGFLVTDPWPTLSILGVAYLISIPVSVVSFRRLKARAAETPHTPS
jgi:CDP-diacylglycerol--serine O-phosphatidyltransferase